MTPPCSKTSPTEGLNLSPSLAIHLALSLAEMQLIRIERAKCAEIERAGCALAHAGGRTVSHSPEQIQIRGFRSSTSWPNFISSFPPCLSEFFSESSILQQPWQGKKNIPSSCAAAAVTPPKLFTPTTLTSQSVKNTALTQILNWLWEHGSGNICVFWLLVYMPPPTHSYPAVDISQGQDRGTAGGSARGWGWCSGVWVMSWYTKHVPCKVQEGV